jgi:hypothetical protein
MGNVVNRSSSQAPANYRESIYSDSHLKKKQDRNDEEQLLYEALVEEEANNIMQRHKGQYDFLRAVINKVAQEGSAERGNIEAKRDMTIEEDIENLKQKYNLF